MTQKRTLNIVQIAGHACIRVTKQAIPLVSNGHRLHIIANRVPSYSQVYKTVTVCEDAGQFSDAIKLYAPIADVFHCHNEPSWFVTAVKEITGKPVVLDVHDSFLGRVTPEEEEKRLDDGETRRIRVQTEERNNFQLADALVFPSEPFGRMIVDEYRIDTPSMTLPSYLPESLYVYNTKEHWGGLVYEGRVDLKEEIAKDHRMFGFKYCDYEDMAKECHRVGIDFHIMSGRRDEAIRKVYGETAFIHDPYAYDVLLNKISRHDWGLVGNIFSTSEWDVALPNKLFEYIAACVPVVVINAKESARFVEKYGIGIVVNNIEELASRWSEHRECRRRLVSLRKRFTMENHIGGLEALYVQLLGE